MSIADWTEPGTNIVVQSWLLWGGFVTIVVLVFIAVLKSGSDRRKRQ